ncbi:MAG TPA: VOC family protein [Alphaproteobacteria bacterium]
MPKFRKLVPMLQTLDIGQTVAWYDSVLGFERVGPMGDEWGALRRDDVSIMFMKNAHLGPPHATATQYFTVHDVDAVWDALKGHCQAEWGPEDMPYGLREFAIRDPNGYLLSFGSPIDRPPSSS